MCHANICTVKYRPLEAVKTSSEFYRVLKNGWLMIDDEYPLPRRRTDSPSSRSPKKVGEVKIDGTSVETTKD